MSRFIRNNSNKKNKEKKRNRKYLQKQDPTPQQMFYEIQCSEGIINFMEKEGREYSKLRRRIQKIVKLLIQARNKLLNTYKDLEKFIENSSYYNSYTRDDLINFYEIFEKIKGTSHFKNHKLWKIPKKVHKNDYYEDCELTEEEVDEPHIPSEFLAPDSVASASQMIASIKKHEDSYP
mmetsp:Transcript_20580/g.18220  ORF Transcript_20580/g.18220 Transcript_20580/m.18220 type:complete len:178 (+) Transcript_20580:469-1002(+)